MAQSHTHIHNYPIDPIGPLCSGMRARKREYFVPSYPLGNQRPHSGAVASMQVYLMIQSGDRPIWSTTTQLEVDMIAEK